MRMVKFAVGASALLGVCLALLFLFRPSQQKDFTVCFVAYKLGEDKLERIAEGPCEPDVFFNRTPPYYGNIATYGGQYYDIDKRFVSKVFGEYAESVTGGSFGYGSDLNSSNYNIGLIPQTISVLTYRDIHENLNMRLTELLNGEDSIYGLASAFYEKDECILISAEGSGTGFILALNGILDPYTGNAREELIRLEHEFYQCIFQPYYLVVNPDGENFLTSQFEDAYWSFGIGGGQ